MKSLSVMRAVEVRYICRLRVVRSRPFPTEPTSVAIRQDRAGRWFPSVVVRVEGAEGPFHGSGRATGLDVGLATFATTEDPDSDVENPRFARPAAEAVARPQRNMAKQLPGSANRAKAKQSTARIEERVAD